MAKYHLSVADRMVLHHDVRWPEHANDRWADRVTDGWEDFPDPYRAFGAGEWVEHPELLLGENQGEHDRARIFHEALDEQTPSGRVVVFLIATKCDSPHVRTVIRGDQYQHVPTRAYLYAYGPHEVRA